MATKFNRDYVTSDQPPVDPDKVDKAPPVTDSVDANTVRDARRLQGAKGLTYLKERGA